MIGTRALRAAIRALRDVLYFRGESRVYRLPASRALLFPTSPEFSRDDDAHLAAYAPEEQWHLSRSEQARVNGERRRTGHHAYTICDDEGLVHYSWLSIGPRYLLCDFGPEQFALEDGAATLWDDNTVQRARGRGYHTRAITQRARDAASEPGVEWVYIEVASDNVRSRHNIEKLGFDLVVTGITRRVFGITRRWFEYTQVE